MIKELNDEYYTAGAGLRALGIFGDIDNKAMSKTAEFNETCDVRGNNAREDAQKLISRAKEYNGDGLLAPAFVTEIQEGLSSSTPQVYSPGGAIQFTAEVLGGAAGSAFAGPLGSAIGAGIVKFASQTSKDVEGMFQKLSTTTSDIYNYLVKLEFRQAAYSEIQQSVESKKYPVVSLEVSARIEQVLSETSSQIAKLNAEFIMAKAGFRALCIGGETGDVAGSRHRISTPYTMSDVDAARNLMTRAQAFAWEDRMAMAAFAGEKFDPQSGRELSVQLQSGSGEYTGFVPDMQRRVLMNLIVVAVTAVPALIILGGYAFYFYPNLGSGGGGGVKVGDINGAAVSLTGWLKGHRDNDRELVQGLKGDAYYLITTPDGIKDFAINATCTHLGCVVPWNKAANKFCCPCHGSQYDENGKVVRGPAPLSLALAHTTVAADGNIEVSPWPETDFRTGLEPWWS
jgi:cytochrome b6-f complex iron-sulfur subunit